MKKNATRIDVQFSDIIHRMTVNFDYLHCVDVKFKFFILYAMQHMRYTQVHETHKICIYKQRQNMEIEHTI